MKQIQDALKNLEGFLESVAQINKHPYGNGVNTEKLINDLIDYVHDLEHMVEASDPAPEQKEALKEELDGEVGN